ncbi:MBL fold metallo-hydrolase [Pectinatus brassicae]|uniref:7, 8-dihydropterin-6-yl-methyl-4-(Beta-D-ribofuranosyl)aminobenzene 5'-phosphate synthase n=1 Tax=Pectinatus brassicae TaxID=862415 RepID=A0A840ULQ7_9FIRM|nr:MBL fold metallo-hydrolase [Pectinatus brassicae]MBB5337120.1 7,8-dihydropterin-6-yl-methyl-4-(beta-D-ribofuranosyl)aminobenzene 5'-phosphate synthase [Pectinatus brassicae]
MELKITTLIENMPSDNEALLYEHGLSLFIEFDGKKIIFDTGKSGDYIENAKLLNIPLEKTDTLIVSHGHYDHAGGVLKTIDLLKTNTTMYVGQEFFNLKHKKLEDGSYKFNGIDFSENDLIRKKIKLIKISKDLQFISGNIVIFKKIARSNTFEKQNPKFMVKKNNDMKPDDFADEIVLGLITKKGLVVVAGCSHLGIVNILTSISKTINIPIYAVLGGTHLVEADAVRISKTIEAFRNMNIKYVAVSHCTGETGIKIIKQELREGFILNNTGNVFKL